MCIAYVYVCVCECVCMCVLAPLYMSIAHEYGCLCAWRAHAHMCMSMCTTFFSRYLHQRINLRPESNDKRYILPLQNISVSLILIRCFEQKLSTPHRIYTDQSYQLSSEKFGTVVVRARARVYCGVYAHVWVCTCVCG